MQPTCEFTGYTLYCPRRSCKAFDVKFRELYDELFAAGNPVKFYEVDVHAVSGCSSGRCCSLSLPLRDIYPGQRCEKSFGY
jgi:hypothetical protein